MHTHTHTHVRAFCGESVQVAEKANKSSVYTPLLVQLLYTSLTHTHIHTHKMHTHGHAHTHTHRDSIMHFVLCKKIYYKSVKKKKKKKEIIQNL